MSFPPLVSSHFFVRLLCRGGGWWRGHSPINAIRPYIRPQCEARLGGSGIVLASREVAIGAGELAIGVLQIALRALQVAVQLIALLVQTMQRFHLLFGRFIRTAHHEWHKAQSCQSGKRADGSFSSHTGLQVSEIWVNRAVFQQRNFSSADSCP